MEFAEPSGSSRPLGYGEVLCSGVGGGGRWRDRTPSRQIRRDEEKGKQLGEVGVMRKDALRLHRRSCEMMFSPTKQEQVWLSSPKL